MTATHACGRQAPGTALGRRNTARRRASLAPPGRFLAAPTRRRAAHNVVVHNGPPNNVSAGWVTAAGAEAAPGPSAGELAARVSVARSTGKLDLSELGLTHVPEEVLEIKGLEDLSLAGNRITRLPDELCTLTSLRRLGLAGNSLTALPDDIGALAQLEGLWVHGNQLEALPDSIGNLTQLDTLNAAGNRLTVLPASVGNLRALDALGLAGNRLTALPESIGGLTHLSALQAHGNAMSTLPASIGDLKRLRTLSLQGNALTELPETVAGLTALQMLNVADNSLRALPAGIARLPALAALVAYGNCLVDLPAGLADAPALVQAWLEGNPLSGGGVLGLLDGLRAAAERGGGRVRRVGLDEEQLAAAGAPGPLPAQVQVSTSFAGNAPGYFKRVRGGVEGERGAVLVVAFGSAPGEPNWGGLLKRVRAGMEASSSPVADFDTLFVVDSQRSWYGGLDGGWKSYRSRLAQAAAGYDAVVLLGDSMGASACLMFAGLASRAVAFCPQVDLAESAIRPGSSPETWAALRDVIAEGLSEAPALGAGKDERPGSGGDGEGSVVIDAASRRVMVHTGTWAHDLNQGRMVERFPGVCLKVHGVDSHRLAFFLDKQGDLAPIVQAAVEGAAGLRDGPVRIANLL
ncbi:unnamed protein product [Pedinophyceae sp. YPF-701]|nr:unnamed protein product [Pedinophyceae sp. YPF-701]